MAPQITDAFHLSNFGSSLFMELMPWMLVGTFLSYHEAYPYAEGGRIFEAIRGMQGVKATLRDGLLLGIFFIYGSYIG